VNWRAWPEEGHSVVDMSSVAKPTTGTAVLRYQPITLGVGRCEKLS
jgi:hypothetical protein